MKIERIVLCYPDMDRIILSKPKGGVIEDALNRYDLSKVIGYDVEVSLSPEEFLRFRSLNQTIGETGSSNIVEMSYQVEVASDQTPRASSEATTPTELNLRYGHAPDCLFGMKNSGMCDCWKGFSSNSPKNPPSCPKHNEAMRLTFWSRPGSAPGNGWACESCVKELAAQTTPPPSEGRK